MKQKTFKTRKILLSLALVLVSWIHLSDVFIQGSFIELAYSATNERIPRGPDSLIPDAPRAPDPTNPNSFTGEQYIEDIVQYEDIRDAAVTITNYFLGFLGILALLIIVYAGVMMVVSQDEGAIKSSGTIIMNVLLGILVIFLAYAIVNFIAQVANRQSPGAGPIVEECLDPNGNVISCTPVDPNTRPDPSEFGGQLSTDPRTSIDPNTRPNPDDFILDQRTDVNPNTSPNPNEFGGQISTDPRTDVNPNTSPNPNEFGGQISTDPRTDVNPNTRPDPNEFIFEERTDVLPTMPSTNIPGLPSPPYSNNVTSVVARTLPLTAPIPGVPVMPGLPVLPSVNYINERRVTSVQNPTTPLQSVDLTPISDQTPVSQVSQIDSVKLPESLGTPLSDEDIFEDVISVVQDLDRAIGTTPISTENVRRLTTNVEEELEKVRALLPKTDSVKVTLDNVKNTIQNVGNTPNNQNVTNLKSDLNSVGKTIEKLQKVDAKIRAIPSQGEAPLTVFFDASASIDPTNVTIVDDNIKWSFIDKENNKQIIPGGIFANFTFTEPGSYIVQAQISSINKDVGNGVKDGIATLKVNVLPTNIRMNLNINNQLVDEGSTIRFGLDESSDTRERQTDSQLNRKGLLFDPTLSKPSTGAKITETQWDFGDSNPRKIFTGDPKIFSYPYRKEGVYPVRFSLKDSYGRSKTLSFSIEVTRILPDFTYSPATGTIDTEFVFDSSSSKSSNVIVTRLFEIFDDSGKVIFVSNDTRATWRPKLPGEYLVRLTVEDESRDSNFFQRKIDVLSIPPKASLEVKKDTNGKGGVYLFDASKSFDDDDQSLKYEFYVDAKKVSLKDIQGKDRNENDPVGVYAFESSGIYTVKVIASDGNGNTSFAEREIKVEEFFNGEIIIEPKAVSLGKEVKFKVEGSDISFVYWDFGDTKTERSSELETTHTYTKAGIYDVSVTIYEERQGGEIELKEKRKVYVGDSESPIPVTSFTVGGVGRELIPDICEGGPGLLISRQESLKADASQSVNIDGTNRLLEYTWDFGDGTLMQGVTASHRYTSTLEECFKVFLTVMDKDTKKASLSFPLNVKVVNRSPVIDDLKVLVDNKEFPNIITLRALGAKDLDGEINEYIWRYGKEGTVDPLGIISTRDPSVNINLGSLDLSSGEYNFAFDVTLVDDEGAKTNSYDYLGRIETLEVVIQEKIYPDVRFIKSKQSVKVGEVVGFEVVSTINGIPVKGAKYDFDYNGDGFYEERDTGISKQSFIYEKAGVYEPQVQVKYGGTTTRKSETIQVLPDKIPLEASFIYTIYGNKVIFQDTSTGDGIVRRQWDLNLSKDSDGDGNSSNDVDATLKDVSYEYTAGGEYSISLTVFDEDGKKDDVIRRIGLYGDKSKNIPILLKPDVTKSLQAIVHSTPELKQNNSKIEGELYLTLTPLRPVATFVANSSRGDIAKYVYDFDHNVDSNGDGDPSNDEDNFGTPSYKTGDGIRVEFIPSKDDIKASLNVYDKSGNKDTILFTVKFTSLAEGFIALDTETQTLINEGALEPLNSTSTGSQVPSLEKSESDIDFIVSQVKYMTKDLSPQERLAINKSLVDIKFNEVNAKELGEEFTRLQDSVKTSNLATDKKESVGRLLMLLEKGMIEKDPEAIERGVKFGVTYNELQNKQQMEDSSNKFDVEGVVQNQVNKDFSVEDSVQNQDTSENEVKSSSRIWGLLYFIWQIIKWVLFIIITLLGLGFAFFQAYKRFIAKDLDMNFEDFVMDLKDRISGEKIESNVVEVKDEVNNPKEEIVDLSQNKDVQIDEKPSVPSWLKIDTPFIEKKNEDISEPKIENHSSSIVEEPKTQEDAKKEELVDPWSMPPVNPKSNSNDFEMSQSQQESPLSSDEKKQEESIIDPWSIPVLPDSNNSQGIKKEEVIDPWSMPSVLPKDEVVNENPDNSEKLDDNSGFTDPWSTSPLVAQNENPVKEELSSQPKEDINTDKTESQDGSSEYTRRKRGKKKSNKQFQDTNMTQPQNNNQDSLDQSEKEEIELDDDDIVTEDTFLDEGGVNNIQDPFSIKIFPDEP